MNKPSISVVIAVKNEEKRIMDCLESIKWVDEIIVINNGSIDNTIKICKRYTNKIFQCGGGPNKLIEYNKNFGFNKAKGSWILSIDADERINPQLKEEIQKSITKGEHDAFFLNFKTFFLGKSMKCTYLDEFCHIRLFKKGLGHYPCNKNHEKLTIIGGAGKLKNPIIHLWSNSIESFIEKANFYTSQDIKNSEKQIGLYTLLIHPLLVSLHIFLRKKGYQDRYRGLILSILEGFYYFLENAKIWERQFKSKLK